MQIKVTLQSFFFATLHIFHCAYRRPSQAHSLCTFLNPLPESFPVQSYASVRDPHRLAICLATVSNIELSDSVLCDIRAFRGLRLHEPAFWYLSSFFSLARLPWLSEQNCEEPLLYSGTRIERAIAILSL